MSTASSRHARAGTAFELHATAPSRVAPRPRFCAQSLNSRCRCRSSQTQERLSSPPESNIHEASIHTRAVAVYMLKKVLQGS